MENIVGKSLENVAPVRKIVRIKCFYYLDTKVEVFFNFQTDLWDTQLIFFAESQNHLEKRLSMYTN